MLEGVPGMVDRHEAHHVTRKGKWDKCPSYFDQEDCKVANMKKIFATVITENPLFSAFCVTNGKNLRTVRHFS